MKGERQVLYLSVVKLGRKEASVLQARVYFQSHVFLRLLDLTRNCTSTETTETRHALCLEYIYIYIYIQLTKIPEIDISLYRDDGLAVINQTPQKLEKIKNEICKIFAQNNLRITIEANK